MDQIKSASTSPADRTADALPVERHSFLRGAVGLIADRRRLPEKARSITDFQFGGEFFSLGQAAGGGHLQILGGGGIVSCLRGLEKSEQSSAGGVAAERVGWRLRWRARAALVSCVRQQLSSSRGDGQTEEQPAHNVVSRKKT